MLGVIGCLADSHDLLLLALAAGLCVLSSAAALALLGRAATAGRAGPRLLWLGLAGAAFGEGAWATHFVGMLAYDPGLPVAFAPWPTLASFVLMVMAAMLGFGFRLARPVPAAPDRWPGHRARHRRDALSRHGRPAPARPPRLRRAADPRLPPRRRGAGYRGHGAVRPARLAGPHPGGGAARARRAGLAPHRHGRRAALAGWRRGPAAGGARPRAAGGDRRRHHRDRHAGRRGGSGDPRPAARRGQRRGGDPAARLGRGQLRGHRHPHRGSADRRLQPPPGGDARPAAGRPAAQRPAGTARLPRCGLGGRAGRGGPAAHRHRPAGHPRRPGAGRAARRPAGDRGRAAPGTGITRPAGKAAGGGADPAHGAPRRADGPGQPHLAGRSAGPGPGPRPTGRRQRRGALHRPPADSAR